ncbi:hypothetical protein GON03_18985 [Nocardioides sp. MAH-18]|uniref:Uncharacterized protein n=1 Tax=Nocardioides agri TaxID=2682843 RepID=A0A6L6XV43_9ACTN|nr:MULTISPECIES: hypothetical protein [unclassified Nocardioides]MBA2952102.1 hypothetical protein [Nocardioides sp. CGMCC 1.13656]MVQ51271.1 hypothetical protein [Nocardioides sp. MAH-18]
MPVYAAEQLAAYAIDAPLLTSIASVVVAVVAALAAFASQRAAANASVKNTDTTSRAVIEAEAFERAKTYYTDTIDRQDREIHELEGDVAGLKARVTDLERELAGCRAELDTAKNALRLAFPDEP